MGQGSKSCKQPSHQLLRDKAKNRVQDLQSMVDQLQFARKESRSVDVTTLEEQVNQVLREWKAELDAPSPASSLHEISEGSVDISLLLKNLVEDDDATSPFSEPPIGHGHGHAANSLAVSDNEVYHVDHMPNQHQFQVFGNNMSQQHQFQSFDHCNTDAASLQAAIGNNYEASGEHNFAASNFERNSHLDYLNLNADHDFDNEIFLTTSGVENWGIDGQLNDMGLLLNVNPPPSAFLGPICALWDCARPVLGSDCCKGYCSSFHAELAVKECPPGTSPVLRPGGIGLKDGPLFAALKAKIEGKSVGIPECEGAATAKSPWNASELFDTSFFEGEKIREWLFFDKPRRAFETGNRKQRSLPDHEGRGWHESRKQIMKEYGGLKRSYYADPQPQKNFEWHLFEYELDNCYAFALYRLELKVAEEKKKSPKTKGTNDLLVDLQNRMGRLTAEVATENKHSQKGKEKGKLNSEHFNAPLVSNSSNEINVHGPDGLSKTQSADTRKLSS